MGNVIVRVSILRCEAKDLPLLGAMMAEAESVLRPGIEAMPGLIAFYAGIDEATNSLTNTSLWQTLADAQQLDHFAPMQELGKKFAAQGAVFERPIMNYCTLWAFGDEACGSF